MTASLQQSLDELFAGVGSPRRLQADRVRLRAWLAINGASARVGRPQPGGDLLLSVGTAREVDAVLAVVRAEAAGGPFVVEYSAEEDRVRVSTLQEAETQARAVMRRGVVPVGGWYVVHVGEEEDCRREASRLRRVRAGHRSQRGTA